MAKLLIVQDSIIEQVIFKELLEKVDDFDYDIVDSYAAAKELLSKARYEFCVVDHILKDAPHGEIIALFNKYNLAPLVFTSKIDEDFFDDFEGAKIIDYIQKVNHDNEEKVIKMVQQLKANKKTTVMLVSDSSIFSSYQKSNLQLHGFKVLTASNNDDAYAKIDLHPEISLLIIDSNEPYVKTLDIIQHTRKISDKTNILIFSETNNSYFTSQMLKAGANDYLIKDFSRDEFYVRVYQNINKLC